jgi:copper(I)-binding protein
MSQRCYSIYIIIEQQDIKRSNYMATKHWLGLLFATVIVVVGLKFRGSFETQPADTVNAEPQKITMTEAYLNLPPPGHSTTAAYVQIANRDKSPITITGFGSTKASRVELHEHIHADGMMKMREVDQLTLAAMQTEVFKPMGYHLMVFGLSDDVVAGQSVEFTATMASGERIVFQAQARGLE